MVCRSLQIMFKIAVTDMQFVRHPTGWIYTAIILGLFAFPGPCQEQKSGDGGDSMKCFKQMLELMHIPQATNAPGDLCQGLFKGFSSKKQPLFTIILAPHSPAEGLGWPRMCCALEGIGQGENKVWGFLAGSLGGRAWPWRGGRTRVLSGCVVCVHTQREIHGASRRDLQENRSFRPGTFR